MLFQDDGLRQGTLMQRSESLFKLGSVAFLIAVAALNSPGLAAIIIFCLLVAYCHKRRMRENYGTHGTARWATGRDLKSSGCIGGGPGFLLGTTIEWGKMRQPPVDVYVPDRFPHLSIVGPSGSGKSTCFSITNLLTRDWASCIIVDPKGEIARQCAEWRAKYLGHQIVIIDPYGISGVTKFGSAKLNPLRLGKFSEKLIADDSRRLANALVVRTQEERDPFWPQSAQVLIQTITAFLMSEAKPEHANLNRLRDILTNSESTQEILQYMASTDHCYGLLRRMAGQILQLKGQTAASVFGVANSNLEFLDSVPISEILTETSFDPNLLLHNKMSIFLCLPVDRILEIRALQRILITSLINFVFSAGESKTRRVRMILDEAAALGEIDSLYNAIAFGRGFGLRATLMFQSASQIAQCFPESKAADYKGTVASVYCGVNDYAGAEEVSKWIGQTTVTTTSFQQSSNWGSSQSYSGQGGEQLGSNSGGGNSHSYSQAGRALIQAEELLQLPSNVGIALLPNIRPILFKKVPYYSKRERKKGLSNVQIRAKLLLLMLLLIGSLIVIGQAILEQMPPPSMR